MKYSKILKELATRENCSKAQIENEMKIALKFAGIDCSPKKFIEKVASVMTSKDYI